MSIEVEVNVDVVAGKLDRLARMVGREGREIANRALAIKLRAWVMENFEKEGKLHDPRGWLPHAPATTASRARKIGGKEQRAYVRRLYRMGFNRAQVLARTRKAYPGEQYLGRFPILQDTGQLKASFREFSNEDIAGVGAKSYVDSRRKRKPPADLAAIHQYGGGHVPARPMLPTREQALRIGVKVYDWQFARMIDEVSR